MGVASSQSGRGQNRYVMLWKKAYDHHLPEIRQTLKSRGGGISGLSGSGAFTLVAL